MPAISISLLVTAKLVLLQDLTPIELALMHKKLDVVEMLMEKYGCEVNPTVFKVKPPNHQQYRGDSANYVNFIVITDEARRTIRKDRSDCTESAKPSGLYYSLNSSEFRALCIDIAINCWPKS